MTVPTSWQIRTIPNPFGRKYVSNLALKDPCAVSSNGADCDYRPLVGSLGADQIVLQLSVPAGGALPPLFSILPGSRFTVDGHDAVWRSSSHSGSLICPGTTTSTGLLKRTLSLERAPGSAFRLVWDEILHSCQISWFGRSTRVTSLGHRCRVRQAPTASQAVFR